MAEVPTTGLADYPGRVRRTDTTINVATIDNIRYAYWLQCQIRTARVDARSKMRTDA